LTESSGEIEPVLKVGWLVAVTLREGTSPRRCYAGKIQAIDERGIRLAVFDDRAEEESSLTGFGLFIPHANIDSALVAAEDDDLKRFEKAALSWRLGLSGAISRQRIFLRSESETDLS
jgi:hypothetical protein